MLDKLNTFALSLFARLQIVRSEAGQAMVEYTLIVALLSIGAIFSSKSWVATSRAPGKRSKPNSNKGHRLTERHSRSATTWSGAPSDTSIVRTISRLAYI